MKSFTIYCEDYDFTPLAQAFLPEIKAGCPVACELVFMSGDEIRALNARTRGVDAVTDVLSFPTLGDVRGKKLAKKDFPADVDEQGKLIIGSIAICEARAREQAEEYGHGYLRELNYLAAHGVCHLLGYDHMEEDEKREMRAAEERVLARAGIERI